MLKKGKYSNGNSVISGQKTGDNYIIIVEWISFIIPLKTGDTLLV